MNRLRLFHLMTFWGCMAVVACAASNVIPSPTVPKSFCDVAKPIRFDKADKLTPKTADAIIKHNEAGKKLCGWTP